MCVQLNKALFLNRLLWFSVLGIQQSNVFTYIHTRNGGGGEALTYPILDK